MMFDMSNMSAACIAGAQAQTYTTTKIMWDDIQQLKKDMQKLADAINHINSFLREAFP